MRRQWYAALALLLVPSFAHAEGFGTPTVDGLLEAGIYGAAEASDPQDAPQGNPPMDLGDLYVANDNDFWYFYFTVYEDIATTNWGKYALHIDTTNDAAGGTTDAWGRNIEIADPHKAEYSVRSWVDGGGAYGAGKTQLFSWDGAAWNAIGQADDAALNVSGGVSALEWKIARSAIGNPSTIWCSVVTTSGGGTDNGQDTINDPADDWNATDWVTTAVISNSTEVALSSGSDTTPPTLVDGRSNDINDGFSDTVILTFSEPVDTTTALTASNYTDLGGRSVFSPTLTSPTTVEILVSPVYDFGVCNQISVAGVTDLAGNSIVANGTTNVANFYGYSLTINGFMQTQMQANDTPPHTFALEGSQLPLTWDPLCDLTMVDQGDSVYAATVNFCLPCSTGGGGPAVQTLEYKFTHQCTIYESMPSNHFYTIDLATVPSGVDTVNIYWDDQAPVDFTSVDIDVVFRVDMNAVAMLDSVAVGGSSSPLSWDVPPTNFLADDGVGDDAASGDGIYTARITFPTGTLKNNTHKFLSKAVADSVWNYECFGQPDRSFFLDDSTYSTSNPLILDVALWDDCINATDVSDLFAGSARALFLEPARPNPTNGATAISFSLQSDGPVRLEVFDVAGRLVRTLVDDVRPAGRHTYEWDGRDLSGAPLPTGVYFTRAVVSGESATRKLVMIR